MKVYSTGQNIKGHLQVCFPSEEVDSPLFALQFLDLVMMSLTQVAGWWCIDHSAVRPQPRVEDGH